MTVALSPDGKFAASGSRDKTIKIWDLATNKEIATLKGHKDYVECLRFSPDGKTLVSSSNDANEKVKLADSVVKFWDAETWKERASISQAGNWIRDLGFSPDGKTLITRSMNHGDIRLWDAAALNNKASFAGFADNERSKVCFTPDGKFLAVHMSQVDPPASSVRFLDPENGKTITTVKGKGNKTTGVVFSPDGKLFAFNGQLWDAETKKSLRSLKGIRDDANFWAFSPSGDILVTSGVVTRNTAKRSDVKTAVLTLWETESGKELVSVKHEVGEGDTQFLGVVISADGKLIAAANPEGVVLYDTGVLLEKNKK
jgi:WD40 repeat protein